MKNQFTFVFALTLVTGLFTLSGSHAQAQSYRLWTKQFASSSKCRSYSAVTGPENFQKTIRGFKWPMPKGSGIEFIDRTIKHLNAAAAGRANDKVLLARLLAAANSNAYTRNDFESRGGASPSFEQSILIRAVAQAVSYLRSRDAISSAEIKTVDKWVRKLLKTQSAKAYSLDHKASVYSAEISWGAAIGDKALFQRGFNKINSVLGKLKSKPYFESNVRVNNEVIPVLIIGMHVLRLNGVDLFSKKYGKHSFHDAILHHANWVSSTGTKKIVGDPIADPVARSIMKSDGAGTHQAWIPVYLAHFPKSHAAPAVRALHKKVKSAQNIPYYGRNMGIHASCYFGL